MFVVVGCVGHCACASAVGLVVKYLVANEMPRVRFPDGASFYYARLTGCQTGEGLVCELLRRVGRHATVILFMLTKRYRIRDELQMLGVELTS